MTAGTGPGRYRRREPAGQLARVLGPLCAALAAAAAAAAAGGCGSSSRGHGNPAGAVESAPVTAVPATPPPTSPWTTLPEDAVGSRLGRWELRNRFLVLAALGNQGLATVTRPDQPTIIVFRGDLSIPPTLRHEGWDHVGDPGSWHGYLFDAYQRTAGGKLFEVTTPSGYTHEFIHPLVAGEASNNSFAAVTPDGQWMVSGEWGETKRLLVFPTPVLNPVMPVQAPSLPLAATIRLDRPVRDVQGCTFDSPTELLCSSADPGTDLWPTPDQLLQVTLTRPLDGRTVTAHVASLGQLPQWSGCAGPYEPEGIDYDPGSRTLRVEVLPPGSCALSVSVYDYRHATVAQTSTTSAP